MQRGSTQQQESSAHCHRPPPTAHSCHLGRTATHLQVAFLALKQRAGYTLQLGARGHAERWVFSSCFFPWQTPPTAHHQGAAASAGQGARGRLMQLSGHPYRAQVQPAYQPADSSPLTTPCILCTGSPVLDVPCLMQRAGQAGARSPGSIISFASTGGATAEANTIPCTTRQSRKKIMEADRQANGLLFDSWPPVNPVATYTRPQRGGQPQLRTLYYRTVPWLARLCNAHAHHAHSPSYPSSPAHPPTTRHP